MVHHHHAALAFVVPDADRQRLRVSLDLRAQHCDAYVGQAVALLQSDCTAVRRSARSVRSVSASRLSSSMRCCAHRAARACHWPASQTSGTGQQDRLPAPTGRSQVVRRAAVRERAASAGAYRRSPASARSCSAAEGCNTGDVPADQPADAAQFGDQPAKFGIALQLPLECLSSSPSRAPST